jgi:hypothetical protein
MELYPAVIVHGLGDAVAALAQAEAEGAAVTLLSAPGAALYAGCGWWRALVEAARARHPNVPCVDILDCADATGQALAALRVGLPRLVLWPNAPGRDAVVAIAESMGGFVLAEAPVNPPVNFARVNRDAASISHVGPGEPDRGTGQPGPGKR